jgi:DNA invertase Pin-like site-specific DNA recombinase
MKFIGYYRVSTQKQGLSGLGLEAQQKDVEDYVAGCQGELISEYTEVQSGSKDDRPELHKALRQCRLTGATLLIAKLDRLSRNRRFLLELADSTTNFIAVDMPEANNFTVGLLACLADYERQLISERTKAGLRAAKARGVKLGNPDLDKIRNKDTRQASATWQAQAKARKADYSQIIEELMVEYGPDMSLRQVAAQLNQAGYRTPRGGQWHPTSVARVMNS